MSLAAAAPAAAQQTRSAVPGKPSPPAALNDLGWIAGAWVGEGIAGPAREVYSPPMGRTIAGHFVQTKGDGIMFYEILSIAQVGPTITYRLKHFNPDLTGWEEKNKVVEFRFVGREGDTWYFDGLTIRRVGPDEMHAIVKVRHDDGKAEELTFRYRRER
jgi:hypothetical protein